MPRLVRAFACEFGCGRKVETQKRRMTEHEGRCFHNPIKRACQTCAHMIHETETIYNPYHNGNPGSTDYEARANYCEEREDVNLQEKLVCDCPSWKQK